MPRLGRWRCAAAHPIEQSDATCAARPISFRSITMLKRKVLITGAGSGLGRGLSICLAQEGHSIMATDIDLAGAQETVSQIKVLGGEAEPYSLDVTSEQDIQCLLRDRSEGRIDALINNAGLQHIAKVEEFPVAQWDLLVDVMLK